MYSRWNVIITCDRKLHGIQINEEWINTNLLGYYKADSCLI